MHIVVAIDRSEESRTALANAVDIIDNVGGSITAVHVTDSKRGEVADDVVTHVESRGDARDVNVRTELLAGDPVDEIATFSEDVEADAIYVGHRGLTSEAGGLSGDSRGPLGSVAKGLVERTQIPVTVFDRGL